MQLKTLPCLTYFIVPYLHKHKLSIKRPKDAKREKDKQTKRKKDKQKNSQIEKKTNRKTVKQKNRQTEKPKSSQINTQNVFCKRQRYIQRKCLREKKRERVQEKKK